ncbi:MAG TPA: ATP-binding protein [Acidimicrobiales bacterium]|jgi:two-component system sensor histidine kinase BaeS|nr:ATP-binding protein [Acidimicrobiales bacterium]
MRRRLSIAMVAMVLVTLLLSGAVSLLLAARSTITQTRHELVREATSLAASVQEQSDQSKDPGTTLRNLLAALHNTLQLSGATVVGVRADGRLFGLPVRDGVTLPAGLSTGNLSPRALYKLETVSGHKGDLVYAAVPYKAAIQVGQTSRDAVQVVVLTSRPPSALKTAGPWFALSAVVILLIAAIVSWRLGRRIVNPILATQEVTGRIAAGDLDARVPEPPGNDPELAGLVASVNTMAESLTRAKAAERHFLQSVSHDLRTPLTSIRGFAEAIEDGATADAVAAAGVIASEARRLERLVGDLLALATLEARRFTLQMQAVDLHAAAEQAAAGFVPSAAELGLDLEVATGPPVPVHADPDRLAQVVANLVENALRYAGGRVAISVGPGPFGPELSITDDGPGIPAADLPKVFDRLYRSRREPDGARPGRPIGSGLGLTIVAELVSAMGGSVRAESPVAAEGGTRMVVTLPAAV